jgi:hypothetical protein
MFAYRLLNILWIFSITLLSGTVTSQDLALNRSYTLSTPPNYPYSAPASDKTSLTDGIYTSGNFWTRSTTVGWMSQLQITITIDLGSIQPIGAVSFNTIRNSHSGINFPQNIFVLLSNNNSDFVFAGDAADTTDNFLNANEEVKKFVLNDIDDSARYVALTIVPNGVMAFCDEIEVLKGNALIKPDALIKTNKKRLISKENIKQAADSLNAHENILRYLVQSINRIQINYSKETGQKNIELMNINSQLINNNITENNLLVLKDRIGVINASILDSRFHEPFIIEGYNPWDSLSEFSEPKEDAKFLNYQYTVQKGGVQYGSFVITNSSPNIQKFSFGVNDLDTSITNLELYSIPFVQSSYYYFSVIPDPLIRIKGDLTVKPGYSQLFLFRLNGINMGTSKSIVTVKSDERLLELNIDAKVRNLFIPNNLNANVWAYLIYPMLTDRPAEAVKDLESHHINTIVVPPAVIPGLAAKDYSKFANYVSNFKSVKNFLLFMNYASPDIRNGYENGKFMDAEWKTHFIQWYSDMTKLIHDNGFPNSQVYLYPYDEVSGVNIKDFEEFAIWAKMTIPGIKFFATLYGKGAIDALLPLVDIAQIHSGSAGLDDLPAHQCEVWIYNTVSPARSLSPYSYYRLMSWRAFVNDYKGIGFWDYADEGNYKKLNLISDQLLNPSNSYSVIYSGSGKEIISSRRWEAFRLGIEDYSILYSYAMKFGLEKTKVLARQVLDDPQNVYKADIIISEMVSAL